MAANAFEANMFEANVFETNTFEVDTFDPSLVGLLVIIRNSNR